MLTFYSINSFHHITTVTWDSGEKLLVQKMTRYDDTSFYSFSQQSTVSFVVSQVTEEQRLMQLGQSSDKIKASSDKIEASSELENSIGIVDTLRSSIEKTDFNSELLKLRRASEVNGLKEESESHHLEDLNSNSLSIENRAESVV